MSDFGLSPLPLLPISQLVACPRCNAAEGSPCLNDQGKPAGHHHAVRTRAAENHMAELLKQRPRP